jgi:hypothetical protein
MDKRRKQKAGNSPDCKRTTKSFRARAEIPGKASIVSTEIFISPKKRRYLILETDQTDPYDASKKNARKRRGE